MRRSFSLFSGLDLLLFGLAALAILLLTMTMPLHAAEAGTTVSIGWGQWLSQVVSDLTTATAEHPGTIVGAIILWLIRKLPSQLTAILLTWRVDQLLERAITYGLNSVANASAMHRLEIGVASPVLAQALTYAVENGASAVIDFAGGKTAIANKIWARLDLEAGARATNLQSILDKIAPTPTR